MPCNNALTWLINALSWLIAAISYGLRMDLRGEFRTLGFPIDDTLFSSLQTRL